MQTPFPIRRWAATVPFGKVRLIYYDLLEEEAGLYE